MNLLFSTLRALKTQILLLSVVAILLACSTVPINLRTVQEPFATLADVQGSPESYKNESVRWGGSIVDVQHVNGETIIQVVSRPLSSSSRPTVTDQTDGRFLAVFSGFLEPQIYKEKRLLTVLGLVAGLKTQKIGDLDYDFPVLRVKEHYLWKKEMSLAYPYRRDEPYRIWGSPYLYYYDEFYSPFWHRKPPRSR